MPKKLMRARYRFFLSFICSALWASVQAADISEYDSCLLKNLKTIKAVQDIRVNDVLLRCKSLEGKIHSNEAEEPFTLQKRVMVEKNNLFSPYTLMAYKPNYILPVAYNRSGYDASLFQQQFQNQELSIDDVEAEFQISFKAPLVTNLFNKNYSLFVGYTNKSFWQLYNKEISSPFRETNHEPELWLQMPNGSKFLGFKNSLNMIGISHQSNGRGGILSRSWNRVYLRSIFEKGPLVLSARLWSRITESAVKDDNPDIIDFLGHGEFYIIVNTNNNHTISLMLRNNLESSFERGTTELSWSFSLNRNGNFKGYVKIFSGYGESLIDYNQSITKLGLGISLSDWL